MKLIHLNENSILVSLNGATWGRFGLYHGEKILPGKSLGYINISNSQASKAFIYYQLQLRKIRKFFESDITGSTIKNLSLQTLRNTEVNVPTLEEQHKIANFLTTFDKKIQLQQQKIDLLKEQKKGYMQKIFKQELRFKDDNKKYYPEWENKKIKELFQVTRGNVLSKNKISESGNYPVYSSQTKNNGLLGYYDKHLFENAITWTTDGANAGNVKYRKGKFYCTNVCGVLLNYEGYANNCIAEMLNSVAFKYVSYVGNPKLMNNVMGEIHMDFPCVKEQKKISSFLAKLDKITQKEREKLTILKEQKKGFMQKMLV